MSSQIAQRCEFGFTTRAVERLADNLVVKR